MVAIGFTAQFLTGGLFHQAYGAYVVMLQADLGWNSTTLSGAYSLARFESGLLGPVEGWLVDRFGPRKVMRAGILLFGIGFILFSQIDSFFTFYFAFLIMALGVSIGGFLPMTVVIVNWFHQRRATALSTMSIGFALGGLAVPIVVFCLETFGWRTTAFASGVLLLAISVPLTHGVRHRPEDYGMQADGGPTPATTSNKPAFAEVSFRAREALHTRAFWMISLGHGSALLVVAAVMVHLVPHLHHNLGYPLATAGLVVSLLTGMQIVGQVAGGYLGDRFSKRLICAACMGAHMVGLLLVTYASEFAMILAFTILHGLAWGIRGPLMQAIRADYFGRAAFGLITGLSSLIVTFGNAGGPLVAGALADITGSYQIGFTVLAILSGLGSIFFILATRPPPPRRVLDSTGALTPFATSGPWTPAATTAR